MGLLEGGVAAGLVFLGRDVVELDVRAQVVEPIDLFHRRVVDIASAGNGPVWNGVARRAASVRHSLSMLRSPPTQGFSANAIDV